MLIDEGQLAEYRDRLMAFQDGLNESRTFAYPSPDYGGAQRLMDSVALAYETGFGSSAQRSLMIDQVRIMDQDYMGSDAVYSKEEFENEFGGFLQYTGQTRSEAYLQAKWKLSQIQREERLYNQDSRSPIPEFLAGMAGSIAHPLDMATMVFLPNMGAARTGGNAARFSLQHMTRAIYGGMKAGAIDAAWQTPAILSMQKRLQGRYTIDDAMMDFAFGPVAGGVLGGGLYGLGRVLNSGTKKAVDSAAAHRAVSSEEAMDLPSGNSDVASLMARDPKWREVSNEFKELERYERAIGRLDPEERALWDEYGDLDSLRKANAKTYFTSKKHREEAAAHQKEITKRMREIEDRVDRTPSRTTKQHLLRYAHLKTRYAGGSYFDNVLRSSTRRARRTLLKREIARMNKRDASGDLSKVRSFGASRSIIDPISPAAEKTLTRFFRKLGADVRFTENLDAAGRYNPKYPNTIFLKRVSTDTNPWFAAFHEYGHWVRRKNPEAYNRMVDAILRFDREAETGEPGSKTMVDAAYEDLSARYGKDRWRRLSDDRKAEELVSNVLSVASRTDRFWKYLAEREPGMLNRFKEFVRQFLDLLRGVARRNEDLTPWNKTIEELVEAVRMGAGEESGFDLTKRRVPELIKRLNEANRRLGNRKDYETFRIPSMRRGLFFRSQYEWIGEEMESIGLNLDEGVDPDGRWEPVTDVGKNGKSRPRAIYFKEGEPKNFPAWYRSVVRKWGRDSRMPKRVVEKLDELDKNIQRIEKALRDEKQGSDQWAENHLHLSELMEERHWLLRSSTNSRPVFFRYTYDEAGNIIGRESVGLKFDSKGEPKNFQDIDGVEFWRYTEPTRRNRSANTFGIQNEVAPGNLVKMEMIQRGIGTITEDEFRADLEAIGERMAELDEVVAKSEHEADIEVASDEAAAKSEHEADIEVASDEAAAKSEHEDDIEVASDEAAAKSEHEADIEVALDERIELEKLLEEFGYRYEDGDIIKAIDDTDPAAALKNRVNAMKKELLKSKEIHGLDGKEVFALDIRATQDVWVRTHVRKKVRKMRRWLAEQYGEKLRPYIIREEAEGSLDVLSDEEVLQMYMEFRDKEGYLPDVASLTRNIDADPVQRALSLDDRIGVDAEGKLYIGDEAEEAFDLPNLDRIRETVKRIGREAGERASESPFGRVIKEGAAKADVESGAGRIEERLQKGREKFWDKPGKKLDPRKQTEEEVAAHGDAEKADIGHDDELRIKEADELTQNELSTEEYKALNSEVYARYKIREDAETAEKGEVEPPSDSPTYGLFRKLRSVVRFNRSAVDAVKIEAIMEAVVPRIHEKIVSAEAESPKRLTTSQRRRIAMLTLDSVEKELIDTGDYAAFSRKALRKHALLFIDNQYAEEGKNPGVVSRSPLTSLRDFRHIVLDRNHNVPDETIEELWKRIKLIRELDFTFGGKSEVESTLGFLKSLDRMIDRRIADEHRRLIRQHQRTDYFNRELSADARSERDNRDWLATFLNGITHVRALGRNVVPVDSLKKSRVNRDYIPFYHTLIKHGLFDQFRNNRIMKEFARAMRGGDVESPGVAEAAKVLTAVLKRQMGEINLLGGNMRWLDGYLGFSQTHNADKFKAMSFEDWSAKVNEWIDWDATERAHGHVLIDENGEAVPFDRTAYLKSFYDDVVNGHIRDIVFDPEDAGGDLASRTGRQRKLHFKETHGIDYDIEFGSGDPANAILNQLARRSEHSALMESFGPDFKESWNVVENRLRLSGVSPGRIKWLKTQFDQVTGELDNPVDANLAQKGMLARQYSNIVFLGKSGVAALTDIPSIVAKLKYDGVSIGFRDQKFWKAYKQAFDRQRRGKNDETVLFFRSMGAGMDAIRNANARRFTGEVYEDGKAISRANDWMFNINGLNLITSIGQEVVMDFLSRALAKAEIDPAVLARFGITEAELNSLPSRARKIEGLDGDRVAPHMIEATDPVLARKLRVYLDHAMREAVIEPDPGTLAFTRLGLKDGTIEGVGARVGLQYMTFPLAITRKTYSRLLRGYGHENFSQWISDPRNRAKTHTMSFMAASLAMGFVATNIKDLLDLRTPTAFHALDKDNMFRVIRQSGVGGALETSLAPLPMNIAKVAKYTMEGDLFNQPAKVLNKVFETSPGASLPIYDEMSRGLFALVMGDALIGAESYLDNRAAFVKRTTGQGSLLADEGESFDE